MTSKEDWSFRARTLYEAASSLRRRAQDLISEAQRYENLARDAEKIAATSNVP